MLLSLKIAFSSLLSHKLRALLAMLGVFLGALALTGVMHVSKAMLKKAEIETEKLGPNLFSAVAGQVRFRRSGSARISGGTRTFTVGDASALIENLHQVKDGTPYVATTMPVRSGRTKVMTQLVAAWPNYPEVRSFNPALGRFFTWREERERDKVCVLGQTIARRLFGSPEAALGQTVFFFKANVRVVGVMESKGKDLSGTDQDEQVFVPLSTYLRRFANQTWISGVHLNLWPSASIEETRKAATQLLRERHRILAGEKDDFSIFTARDAMQVQQQALDLVRTLGLLSSSISFAVGGLGILSIMVLLVRTRRMEIGIRRAVGARRRDIVRQFLLEAGLMAGVGGLFGVLAALILLLIVYQVGDFPHLFDVPLLLATLISSGLLGLGAGSYPAWQASRIEVLDILRKAE